MYFKIHVHIWQLSKYYMQLPMTSRNYFLKSIPPKLQLFFHLNVSVSTYIFKKFSIAIFKYQNKNMSLNKNFNVNRGLLIKSVYI